ncbi:MAG: methyltransferase, partial [Saprospiraceae bacterium]
MLFDEKLYEYANQNSSDLPDYLNDLLRETALTTVNPFMACGPVMGRFLTQISKWMQPRAILEIGSFTGYSALSLAQGLAVNGSIT